MKLAFACYAVAVTTVALILAVWALTDPIPRYARLPVMDSQMEYGQFIIDCKAYSNRPDFTEAADGVYGVEMVGFRVVSDCLTVAK